jgi:hypothetical protein
MTLQQIKDAVESGRQVFWKHEGYEVKKDSVGQWLIVHKNMTIGLTHQDGVTMNGEERDFYLAPTLTRKNFGYRVEATVTLTKAELGHIVAVAASHYDGKCNEFGRTTARYWHDTYGHDESPPETVKEITVKWSEFDIVSKILEQERFTTEKTGISLYNRWTDIFRELRDESERLNARTMIADTETYREEFREELRRKYGTEPQTVAR